VMGHHNYGGGISSTKKKGLKELRKGEAMVRLGRPYRIDLESVEEKKKGGRGEEGSEEARRSGTIFHSEKGGTRVMLGGKPKPKPTTKGDIK